MQNDETIVAGGEPGYGRISRLKFIGLGVSAAVVCSVATPFVAKAKTVSFGGATTGRLSSYCRGDGSDETEAINRCFADNLYVEVDEPPAGIGYGFRIADPLGGLILRSGHEIGGLGAKSKFLRVGKWMRNGKGFTNDDRNNGNSSIKLDNIYIDGANHRPDVPKIDSNADSTGIAIRSYTDGKWCSNISFNKVQMHNWPGVALRIRKGSNVTYRDVKSVNPARGGVIFNTSKNIKLERVRSVDSGDDAIAFYSTGIDPKNYLTDRPMYGIEIKDSESRTRPNPEFGAALKFGGASDARVTNSTFGPSKNSVIILSSYKGGFDPNGISVKGCTIKGGMKHSYQIVGNRAKGVVVSGNYMSNPARDCINILSPDGFSRKFDVMAANNVLISPGSKHLNVQSNVSGVRTSGNRYLSSDAKPVIEDVSPKPNSRTKDRTVTIKATVRDAISDLTRDDIELYVSGKKIGNFTYSTSKNTLTFTTKKMTKGKKYVRVVARDNRGHYTSKSWSFKVY